ncbi:Sporulation related domain-containing protein [Thalassobacillus cyri]|uniref:Sporulation related domain-containing protein n=1 Tax=Thalassobacillus cyri TaxID=571932 RepID=A0A1H4DYF5_9BACI|nr:phosphodiester glycosidase family protein [Thalassobacillus cyri]SEA77380.1 Sporulation related domain-containing protein [Thalassobacillus cyri]
MYISRLFGTSLAGFIFSLLFLIGGLSSNVVSAHPASTELHLGNSGLEEVRETEEIAPGVTYTHIERGHHSKHEVYTVNVSLVETREESKDLSKKLKADGYQPYVTQIKDNKYNDIETKRIAYLVRVGEYQEEEQARQLESQLEQDGYSSASTTFTAFDGTKTDGPWSVNIIEVDPDTFQGKIISALAQGVVQGKERVTDISDRTGALAAVNGGYFVVGSRDGTPGKLAGVSMVEGELVSEAVSDRTSLVFTESEAADIAEVATEIKAESSDGAATTHDGMNRKPGLIRSCGGTGGDEPTEEPRHDVTCTDDSELILYKPVFGGETPAGDGLEVVLDTDGQVIEVRDRGGAIPENGTVIAGTGEEIAWLEAHAQPGMTVDVTETLVVDGEKVATDEVESVVNGGPRLIENGEISIHSADEGFYWGTNFLYNFAIKRHPRTLAGIKENGNLLFVTVDGRADNSIGVNFLESAKLMKSLGAVEAMNLDGGGSSTMAVGSELVNQPSDSSGERPVGDAIVILPD